MGQLLRISEAVNTYGRTKSYWVNKIKNGHIGHVLDPDTKERMVLAEDIEAFITNNFRSPFSIQTLSRGSIREADAELRAQIRAMEAESLAKASGE